MKLVKILFVLLTALAVLNCSSNGNDGSAAGPIDPIDPIIGTWKGKCRLFTGPLSLGGTPIGAERETYTFTSSTLMHLREVYIPSFLQPGAPPNCSAESSAEITSRYNITIGSSASVTIGFPPGSEMTVNGSEINYTWKSAKAAVRRGSGSGRANGSAAVTAINTNFGLGLTSLLIMNGAPIMEGSQDLSLPHQLTRPSQGTNTLYSGVYYIDTSVSPHQLYTRLDLLHTGATVPTRSRLATTDVYERR